MRLLSTPLRIRSLELKNRVILPAMAHVKGDAQSRVTPELCDYYRGMAARGYGLIVTEHCFVSPEGQASFRQLSVSRDSDVEGLSRIADSIHAYDTPVIAQINHAGGAAKREVTGCTPLAPSAVHVPDLGDPDLLPDVLTESDIARITDDFVSAALRVRKAGFDGVEIHAAHGYLLSQFFSPITNHREDAWTSATLEGRIRFQLSVIRAVRSAVGDDYPIAVRYGCCDYLPGGCTVEDAGAAAPFFAAAGTDLFDVSGAMCHYRRPGHTEPGYFSDQTEAVRKQVSVPVVLTGGIQTPEQAEQFLSEGKADLIGLGRLSLRPDVDFSGWF